jgi:RNA polymerase subunit RPABC4/transcription elongation factor Spt4
MSWTFCHRCGAIIPEGADRCCRCHAIQAPAAWTTSHWLQLALLVGLATASVVVGLLALAYVTR